jgi:FkbM family methyltransferase
MINWPQNRYPKQNAFVTVSTDFGPMLVNRFDYNVAPDGGVIGVGHHLLNQSSFDAPEINTILQLLMLLRATRGDGVVMFDGGANVGVHSLASGRLMTGWGSVIAYEAQERIFYALAGNVTMNNLFNVRVNWGALAEKPGKISIPVPNYLAPASFGSLEMQQKSTSENIGQTLDPSKNQSVDAVSIDSLKLDRVDFIKLDVEGMEDQVIRGAAKTIKKCLPLLHVEVMKDSTGNLRSLIQSFGYTVYNAGPNAICVPAADPINSHINT